MQGTEKEREKIGKWNKTEKTRRKDTHKKKRIKEKTGEP